LEDAAAAAYQQQQGQAGANPNPAPEQPKEEGKETADDVVDADFTDSDNK
jgi:hypothetical protein